MGGGAKVTQHNGDDTVLRWSTESQKIPHEKLSLIASVNLYPLNSPGFHTDRFWNRNWKILKRFLSFFYQIFPTITEIEEKAAKGFATLLIASNVAPTSGFFSIEVSFPAFECRTLRTLRKGPSKNDDSQG